MLPDALEGRYLRIGPNPIAEQDPERYHWFRGDGMVHGVRLRGGRAEWYRNRWVRSTRVSEALGEPAAPGERHAGMDTVNTNIIGHAHRTFALVEAGARPVELSYELETLAHVDLDGTLPNGFTAHPKRDPISGELHAVAYHWSLPHLQYVVVGTDGRVRELQPISVPGSPMVHDISLTERHVVFYDLPVTFDLETAARGEFPYVWNDSYGARIGVMPRGGTDADVRWFEVEPCYVYHAMNAYDGGDTVVLDVIRHATMFDEAWRTERDGQPSLWRWTVDLVAGAVREEQLSDVPQELPRVDERVVGRKHRYGYAASLGLGLPGNGDFDKSTLVKHDLATGGLEIHDHGPGRTTAEGVFVPRSPEAAEDDGWVLSYVYDARSGRSDLVVLDAADFTADPVAVVHLPARVPHGFHGNWVPDPR